MLWYLYTKYKYGINPLKTWPAGCINRNLHSKRNINVKEDKTRSLTWRFIIHPHLASFKVFHPPEAATTVTVSQLWHCETQWQRPQRKSQQKLQDLMMTVTDTRLNYHKRGRSVKRCTCTHVLQACCLTTVCARCKQLSWRRRRRRRMPVLTTWLFLAPAAPSLLSHWLPATSTTAPTATTSQAWCWTSRSRLLFSFYLLSILFRWLDVDVFLSLWQNEK